MITPRLVRVIETRSEQLAQGMMQKLERSGRSPEFLKRVLRAELQQRAYEIYRNLGDYSPR